MKSTSTSTSSIRPIVNENYIRKIAGVFLLNLCIEPNENCIQMSSIKKYLYTDYLWNISPIVISVIWKLKSHFFALYTSQISSIDIVNNCEILL